MGNVRWDQVRRYGRLLVAPCGVVVAAGASLALAPAAQADPSCPPGSYSSGGGPCLLADAGYYVPGPGATAETPCAPGQYQPMTGQSSCIPAEIGHYATGPAAIAQAD